MTIHVVDAVKVTSDIVQAALSSGTIKLHGAAGNVGDPTKNAAADGKYLVGLYEAVYLAVRNSI